MTDQSGEKIIFKDEVHWMYQEPLKLWLVSNPVKLEFSSSAHWRGYAGTWEIKDNKLFLNDIKCNNYTFSQLFKAKIPVFADWFSGEISMILKEENTESDFLNDYEKYLQIIFLNGIITEKQIVFEPRENQLFEFGKYKTIPVLDVINGKWTWAHSFVLRDYLTDLMTFLTTPNFNQNVCTPKFDSKSLEKSPGQSFKDCGLNFFLTSSYIAVSRQAFLINTNDDDYAEIFSRNLERLLTSDFFYLFVLTWNKADNYVISPKTLLLNPDIPYIIWAINKVDSFYVYPHELNRHIKLKKLKTFAVTRLNQSIFEYKPIFVEEEYIFSEEIQEINSRKFTKSVNLMYEKSKDRYISVKSEKEMVEDFKFYLDNETFTSKISQKGKPSASKYEGDFEPYHSSYTKYNGFNGFDDQTIDDAFEGDPMNTWNID